MSKFSTNPFDRTILHDDKLLSGKNHLRTLKNIRKQLSFQRNNASCKSFIIKGERGTGKSSLLKIISNETSNYNFLPISIYLADNNSSDISFFHSLYNGLFNLCKQNEILIEEISKAEISVAKTEIIQDSRFWVFEFINKLIEFKLSNRTASNLIPDDILKDFKLIISKIRETPVFSPSTKIAILVDESQNIFNNSAIMGIIRHILQENIGITFFFAGQSQITNLNATEVFDNLNRNFYIYNLDYFDDINDVKDFFDKSFESIGWKDADIRLNVNNYSSFCKSIYFLTNGKPEFINRIADSMFRRVITGDDRKLRLNEDLLRVITDDLENDSDRNDFSLIRAQKVLKLHQSEYEWFSLFCSSMLTKPREIYDYFSIFFDDFDDINAFKTLVYRWAKEGLFDFLRETKEYEKISLLPVDLNTEDLSLDELIDMPFIYPGSPAEREWLIIKFSQTGKSLSFNSSRLSVIMMSKIARIAGFDGSPRISGSSLKSKVFNSNFYSEGEIVENSFTELFGSAINKKLNLPEDKINFQVEFLFDFLNSKKTFTFVQFYYLNLKINNDYRILCSYTFEKRSQEEMTIIQEKLSKLSSKFLLEKEIEMNYKFENILQNQLCSYSDFEYAILNSDNDEAKLSLLSKSNQAAIALYLDNRESNITQIGKWNEVIYVGIKNNLDVSMTLVNNAGYMFMNLNEHEKAKTCFEFVLGKNGISEIEYLTENEAYYSSLFLSTYNLAILKVLEEKYNDANVLFTDCETIYFLIKNPEFAALNYIAIEDDSIVIKEEMKSKNIDALQLVEANQKHLTEFIQIDCK